MSRLLIGWLLYAVGSLFLIVCSAIEMSRRQNDFAIMMAFSATMFAWMAGVHFADWAAERHRDGDKPLA